MIGKEIMDEMFDALDMIPFFFAAGNYMVFKFQEDFIM
jgi:hypothetical protein